MDYIFIYVTTLASVFISLNGLSLLPSVLSFQPTGIPLTFFWGTDLRVKNSFNFGISVSVLIFPLFLNHIVFVRYRILVWQLYFFFHYLLLPCGCQGFWWNYLIDPLYVIRCFSFSTFIILCMLIYNNLIIIHASYFLASHIIFLMKSGQSE